jgi:hypothetical protein
MEAETFERALHLWDPWRESIIKSRAELGYDPSWPVEKAVTWIDANYAEWVRPKAETELRRLRLPPTLQEYWEDCFYCDYQRSDGTVDFSKIRRCIAYEEVDRQGNKTGHWKPGNKSLPKLPYQASIVYYSEEDIHDPWVRIEVMIHGPLATREMLEAALDQGWRTLNHIRRFPPRWEPHPLSKLIPKAKANQSEAKRWALERFRQGEVDFEGLLAEEWQTTEVQEELRGIRERYGRSPKEFQKREYALQKKVYDRVRRWFPDPKPKVRTKGEWRQRLLL